MATVTAFNDMLGLFLSELHKTFPEEKGLKKFMHSFELLRSANPKKCVEAFMGGVSPHMDKIQSKDDSFFLEDADSIDFLKEMNIKKHWNDDTSDKVKAAIWGYLQQLYMIGTVVLTMPAETLTMIENVAKQCADQIENGGKGGDAMSALGQLDEKALMKMMNGMLGGLMKK